MRSAPWAAVTAFGPTDDFTYLVQSFPLIIPFSNVEFDPLAKFSIGQVVHHLKFGYRGVVVGVDEKFQGSDEWYEVMARSRPPRDKPWYHVLVDEATHRTYVAERHLEADTTANPVDHPELDQFFDGFDNGRHTNSLWD